MSIPTNIADVASQIADGTIGVIGTIKIGDLTVSALTGLQAPVEKDVTRRPVQAGFDVLVGMIDTPTDLIMDVVLLDPDFSAEAGVTAALSGEWAGFTESWRDKRDLLYSLFDGREVVTATTHDRVYPARVIRRINPLYDSDQNWNGWVGQVTLTPFDNRQQGSADDVAGAMTSGLQSVGGL
jgi:hypothetical protein